MKTVTILAGIPGSGKSTYAATLPGSTICSADDFFVVDGIYKYDSKLIGNAHRSCLKKFVEHCQQSTESIIVDNTNTDTVQIAPYYSVARAFDYEVILVKFTTDAEKGFERNVHDVPLRSIKNMANNLARLRLPNYWQITIKEIVS